MTVVEGGRSNGCTKKKSRVEAEQRHGELTRKKSNGLASSERRIGAHTGTDELVLHELALSR